MEDHKKQPTEIRDYRSTLRTLFAANTQTRLLLGLSFLMVVIIAFSNRQSSREPKSKNSQPSPVFPVALSPATIKSFQDEIDAAARRLAEEEAKLARSKKALDSASPAPGSSRPYSPTGSASVYREERPKRDTTLFASNVALTYRSPTGDRKSV